jgi:hypothetical protein
MAALPVVGIGFFVAATLIGSGGGGGPLPEGIEAVFPTENAKTVAQDRVGADLASGWTGRLFINGTEIPTAELDEDGGLNQLVFTPAKGKVLDALLPNRNCATVEYWRLADGETSANPAQSWCFNVV